MIKHFCDRCRTETPLDEIYNVDISKGSSDVEHMDMDTVEDKNVCSKCFRTIVAVLYMPESIPTDGTSDQGGPTG